MSERCGHYKKFASNLENFEGFNAGSYGKFLGLSGHISITFVS